MEERKRPKARQDSDTQARRKLLASARRLFYSQGYTRTTMAQISSDSGVNLGLITYYFGTKSAIASEIYVKLMLDMRNEVARQLFELEKGYSLAMGLCVETRVFMRLRFEDPNLLQYLIESHKDSRPYAGGSPKRDHYYLLQRRLINRDLSDMSLKLYEIGGIAVINALMEAYYEGYIGFEKTEIESYAVRTLLHMLQLPDYQVEALTEKSEYLASRIHVRVTRLFEVQESPIN